MIKAKISQMLGRTLVRYLTKEVKDYRKFSTHRLETLKNVMRPGDVLLVEGGHRISLAIKYLTQSTWSHSAFYVGDSPIDQLKTLALPGIDSASLSGLKLIEADLENGVIAVPLEKYSHFNVRICRPHKLTDADVRKVCDYMIKCIGMKYDLKNITDLMRYLIPQPPVPRRWRRKMLALGSADPTRAICSSLIAQAFQSVHYPILPDVMDCGNDDFRHEILHIRHHSLFMPRDFDISPYFEIIKPTIAQGFEYKTLNWHQHSEDFFAKGEKHFDCYLCAQKAAKQAAINAAEDKTG